MVFVYCLFPDRRRRRHHGFFRLANDVNLLNLSMLPRCYCDDATHPSCGIGSTTTLMDDQKIHRIQSQGCSYRRRHRLSFDYRHSSYHQHRQQQHLTLHYCCYVG
jgi:hypothetical protein